MGKQKNNYGRNSLIFSITGLLLTQALIYFKNFDGFWHTFFHILLAGFEAGTVGGIADWFAVRALFHEIPIPIRFLRKHTNIIAKKRAKMTEGIVDLVTNNWLSPQVIKERIKRVSITEKLLGSVKVNQDFFLVLKPVLSQFITNLDVVKLRGFLSEMFENQLNDFNMGAYLGEMLKTAVEKEEYQKLWEIGLNSIGNTVNTDETRLALKKVIHNQVKKYKGESVNKMILFTLGEEFKAIDYDSIVDKLIIVINEFIEDTKTDSNSFLRQKVDEGLLSFSEKLRNEDKEVIKMMQELKLTLLNIFDTNTIIENLIADFKQETIVGFQSDSNLNSFLKIQLQQFVDNLTANKELKRKIDDWLNDKIEKLIIDNHHEIGKIVETSINNLDDAELIGQIESKVGDDLQYIRLNGAIVGGFIGVFIASLRFLLSV